MFPAIESSVMTRYYRSAITIPTAFEGISAFEVGVFTKYGFILYANGQEVARVNLPATVDESTPCSSVSESAQYRRVSLPIHLLPTTGSVVIAVEVHFDGERTDSVSDDFKGFFMLIASGSSRGFEATFETDHPSSIVTETHENAFDSDLRTKWTASTLPVYNELVFDNDRREFVNAYSVTSSGGLEDRRPAKWTVSASNDGEAWVVLDTKENMHFASKYETMVFEMPHNALSYNRFKFTFDGAAGSTIEVGKIELLSNAVTFAETPVLSYGAASFEFFVGEADVLLVPTAAGFHDFQITGSLPAGLSFSSASGVISGSPSAIAGATSLQVSAQHIATGSSSYSASITISVNECTGARARFDVKKYDAGMGSAEQWTLYSGESVIASHVGRDVFGSQGAEFQTFPFCLPAATYKLVLSQKYQRGWTASSFIDVELYLDDEETVKVVHAINMLNEPETVVEFNTLLLSDNDMTQWKYKADGTVPAGWNTAAFSGSWDAVPATAPTVAHSVWLFRRTITVSSVTGMMGFEMRTLARAGVVVYLNGEEVHRANVEGDVTSTSTSTATTTTSEWRTFNERVGAGRLIAGENVFAVAVVNRDSTSYPLDTKITIRFLTEKGISLGLDTTVSDTHHNNAESVAANLFHGDYSTRHISTASENHLITAVFNHGDRHLVNMYCIVGPRNGVENGPKTWTVETSTDGATFTQVSSFTNDYWNKINERQCYVMLGVTAPVRAIRFHFTAIAETSDNLQMNAIDLYQIDASQMTLAEAPYASPAEFTLYEGADVIIKPAHEYFTQCVTLSPFPAGLNVRSNGVVYGRPTATTAGVGSYQMSCKNAAGTESISTLSISVVACSGSKTPIAYTTNRMDNSAQRLVMLFTDGSGKPFYVDTDVPNYTNNYKRYFCADKSVFSFIHIDRQNAGCSYTYNVVVGDNSPVSGSIGAGASPKTVTVSTVVFLEQGTAEVEYQVANVAPPANWFKKETQRGWRSEKVGQLDKVADITSYYCTTFNAVINELFVSFEAGVRTRGGFILYLNGVELNRVRMPAGEVTKDTHALEQASTSSFIVYADSIFTSALVDGENFLCVEVHKRLASEENNDFDVYVSPLSGNRELLSGGTVTRSHDGYDDGTWHETWEKVFDKKTNTKFFSDDEECSNVWFVYTFGNERKEWATKTEIYKGNGNTRNPTSIRIQASNTPNDKSSWETLGNLANVNWETSSYGEKKTINFLPSKAYSSYRLVLNGCNKEGIELGEWLLYANAIEGSYCRGGNGIIPVMDGATTTGPCDEDMAGIRTYKCQDGELILLSEECTVAAPSVFNYPESEYTWETRTEVTITPTVVGRDITFTSLPKMPEGLELDPATGVISGKPKKAQDETKYVIMARNAGGFLNTEITITITKAKLPIWLWIVIVVVVVAVIVGIVFLVMHIVNKKKEARKKAVKKLPKAAPKAGSKGATKPKEAAVVNKPKIAV